MKNHSFNFGFKNYIKSTQY